MSETTSIFDRNIVLAGLVLAVFLAADKTWADGWELTTVRQEVPGTRAVETGNFDRAIRLSTRFHYRAFLHQAPAYQRVAVLTNLCIAHIAFYEYGRAEVYCQRAAAEPTNRSVTYNNLGVLFALRAQLEKAARFFEIAMNSDCLGKCRGADKVSNRPLPRPIARRNFERAMSRAYFANEVDGEVLRFE